MDATTLASKLSDAVLNPLIAVAFAGAFFWFAWGIIEFLGGLSSGSESKEQGKMHMLWGIIGMVIMVGAFAIINIVLHTFGVSLPGSSSFQ